MALVTWVKARMPSEQRAEYEARALRDRAIHAARQGHPCPIGFSAGDFADLRQKFTMLRHLEAEAERKEVELKHSMTVDRLRQLGIDPAALAAYLKDLEGLD